MSDTLFDVGEPLPAPSRGVPDGARCGRGPTGETCGTCQHLCRVQYRDYFYLKCGLTRAQWTHGRGTDIKARWPACERWEAQAP